MTQNPKPKFQDTGKADTPLISKQVLEVAQEISTQLEKMPKPLPPIQVGEELVKLIKGKVKTLSRYPTDTIATLLSTLTEFPPDQSILISIINKRFNEKLMSANKKPLNGKTVGILLMALGFHKRERVYNGNLVFIDRQLIDHYKTQN